MLAKMASALYLPSRPDMSHQLILFSLRLHGTQEDHLTKYKYEQELIYNNVDKLN